MSPYIGDLGPGTPWVNTQAAVTDWEDKQPMQFGVQVRATADGVDIRWIARAVEERGFESLFLPEHTHVPVVRRSVHPGGEELMDSALKGYDPFVGLAIVAAATERLRVGTGVCLIPQHDPIVLAKQVATLDVLS